MTAVMSTSLKVVSMAAVFCASLRRLAMVRTGGSRLDVTEHAAHLNGRTFLDDEAGNGAGNAGVHLDGNLVGFELAQGLVDGDRVAGLHQPLGDGCLGDRFTQSRNLDLDGHDYNSSFLLALNRQ
jgi:hypothetical protein